MRHHFERIDWNVNTRQEDEEINDKHTKSKTNIGWKRKYINLCTNCVEWVRSSDRKQSDINNRTNKQKFPRSFLLPIDVAVHAYSPEYTRLLRTNVNYCLRLLTCVQTQKVNSNCWRALIRGKKTDKARKKTVIENVMNIYINRNKWHGIGPIFFSWKLWLLFVLCFFVVTRAKCDDGAHRTDAVNP